MTPIKEIQSFYCGFVQLLTRQYSNNIFILFLKTGRSLKMEIKMQILEKMILNTLQAPPFFFCSYMGGSNKNVVPITLTK